MDLEEQLKGALARKPAPDGFAERVAARAATRHAATSYAPWWAAAAAILVMLAGGGAAYRHHRGEAAKEQVMTAMKITAVKLHHIQTHVLEVRQ
jgi:hypothetical protein